MATSSVLIDMRRQTADYSYSSLSNTKPTAIGHEWWQATPTCSWQSRHIPLSLQNMTV